MKSGLRLVSVCTTLILVACGNGNSPTEAEVPFSVSVSEVTIAAGQQIKFTWTGGSIYRMAVVRPNDNGTSTVMWSWEVMDPSFAVSNSIVYGRTPTGASCIIHACEAVGLYRDILYNVTIYRADGAEATLDFTP